MKDSKIDKEITRIRMTSEYFERRPGHLTRIGTLSNHFTQVFFTLLLKLYKYSLISLFHYFFRIVTVRSTTLHSFQSFIMSQRRNSWFLTHIPPNPSLFSHHWILPILGIPADGSIPSNLFDAVGAKKRERIVKCSSRRRNCSKQSRKYCGGHETFFSLFLNNNLMF